jgi:hypothetical protein
MVVPLGKQVYDVSSMPVVARGHEFTVAELDGSLAGEVGDILKDAAGQADLQDLWTSLNLTQFAEQNVRRALQASKPVQDWQVGEAIAEAWLVAHQGCSFPWPFGRDLRNPSASSAGADLVGFRRDPNVGSQFAFGEVKTSGELRFPPQVVNGRHGLAKQVEELRDLESKKLPLVKYLGYRCRGQAWESDYKEAATKYFGDSSDVVLFGVLVRDVAPNQDDLASRSKKLAKACPAKTEVSLFALYLDRGCIEGLPQRARLAP